MDRERRKRNKGKQPVRGEPRNVTYHQGQRRSTSTEEAIRGFLRENEIREKLESRTHNREYPTERFISLRSLEEIWTHDYLERFLDILDVESDQCFVAYVRRNLIKTLSILVAIRWEEWSRFENIFFEAPQTSDGKHLREDSALPFTLAALEEDSFLGKSFAADFLNIQYAYLPIVVEQGENRIYPRTRPLPFLKSMRTPLGAGGFGVVTREVVACHQFKPKSAEYKLDLVSDEITVARKWFRARGDFRKEAQNLTRLNSCLSNHERIVKYLAVITVGDEHDIGSSKEFNILLPLANTDLKGFLYDKAFESNCHGVVDLINEASNLADAIQWLHGGLRIEEKIVVCCHMDIKLDNILVYLDEQASHVGWWKISDFGISSMVEREERRSAARKRKDSPGLLSVPSPAERLARITGSVRVSAKRPGGAYSAPEVAIGNQVGPESDIWSFGCILFQILLRAVGGIKLLTQMDEKRGSFQNGSTNDHFCQESSGGQHLHPQVVKWLESPLPRDLSYKDTECAKKCKKLILQALKIAPSERPRAHDLQKELLKIANSFDQYHSDVESVSSLTSNMSRSPLQHVSHQQTQPQALPQIHIIPSSSLEQEGPSKPPLDQSRRQRHSFAGLPASIYGAPMSPITENPFLSSQRPLTPPPEKYSQFPAATRSVSSPDTGPSSRPPDINFHTGSFSSPLSHRPAPIESTYRNPGRDSDSFKELSPSGPTAMVDRWAHISPGSYLPPNNWPRPEQQTFPTVYNNFEVERQPFVDPPRMYPGPIQERFEHPASPSTSASSELAWQAGANRRQFIEPQYPESQPGLEAFEFPSNPALDFQRDRSRQSSIQSSVPPVEAGPTNDRGETIPFQPPKDTFKTLLSSTRAKIAFISPSKAIVYTLYSPYSRATIQPPNNCRWEKGCLAGDFLALRGIYNSTNSQSFHVYRLATINRALETQFLFFNEDPPNFEKFAVSRDGKVLLGSAKNLWLYQSCTDPRQDLMTITKLTGRLQQVWFSTSGLLAFAWFSLPGNLHKIRVWDVVNPASTCVLDYQIPRSDNSTSAIKTVVYFPKSPICILWKEYDIISLIQPYKPSARKSPNNPHLKGLQALVVTPEENAIIFIRSSKKGFRWSSKISVGLIEKVGDYRILGNISEEENLEYHLEKPDSCDVVIEASHGPSTHVRVLIAHCNGKFEVKEVKLPT